MSRPLAIVVESPARALTLQRMLPRGVAVRATRGHVGTLAPGPGGLPRLKVLRGQARVLQELRRLSHRGALAIATDPDREGEAIAWAVATALGREREACRVDLHALAPGAVEAALARPRALDPGRLQAHLARRRADSLVAGALARASGDLLPPGRGLGRVTAAALAMLASPPLAAPQRAGGEPLTTAALLRGAAAAGITSGRAMSILQRLYDGVDVGEEGACGLVTYPRTDGVAHGPLRPCRPDLLPEALPLSRDERRIYARVHAGDPDPPRRGRPRELRGEAMLLATLDACGVGRPSTLGGVVGALRDRGLAAGLCSGLRLTELGGRVVARLRATLPGALDPALGAAVEDALGWVERDRPGFAGAIERVETLVGGALVRADPTEFPAGIGRSLP